jgi:uncharacterized protein (TIGR01244 family)
LTRQLEEKVLVSGQIGPDDVPELKAQGVTMLVNNRPDGEEPGQPLGAEIEEAASAAGIDYRFIPIIRGIGPADADAMNQAIDECQGKALVFCRSGTRSALAWAVARRAKGISRQEIEQRLEGVGVDPTPIAHLL